MVNPAERGMEGKDSPWVQSLVLVFAIQYKPIHLQKYIVILI